MDPSPSPSTSSPAEIIAGNEDLLGEILSGVPVKPLLRFKSVSKQWYSLISQPRFCLLHCRRHPHPPSSALFFLHRHHSLSSPTFPPLFDFIPLSNLSSKPPPIFSFLKSSKIIQSCNGLLLCPLDRVCNPTTNQFAPLILPHHISELGFESLMGLSLAFDPSRSYHYQVLCVWRFEVNSYAIDLYSSNNHRWRSVINCFTAPFDIEFERGVYCDGRVYWLSHTDHTVFFDLENECVGTLNLPKAMEGAYIERFRYFGESCGHLHLIEIRTNCVSKFDVLELDRENKKDWIVKYRVDLDVVGFGFESEMFQDHTDRFGRGLRFYAFSVLAVLCGVKEDDSVLLVSVPGKVISYNFKTKVSSLVCNVVDESDKWLPFKGYNTYQFIESLYSFEIDT